MPTTFVIPLSLSASSLFFGAEAQEVPDSWLVSENASRAIWAGQRTSEWLELGKGAEAGPLARAPVVIKKHPDRTGLAGDQNSLFDGYFRALRHLSRQVINSGINHLAKRLQQLDT
jgi:hypothetical protein